jgi:hypothetical protein
MRRHTDVAIGGQIQIQPACISSSFPLLLDVVGELVPIGTTAQSHHLDLFLRSILGASVKRYLRRPTLVCVFLPTLAAHGVVSFLS